MKPNAIGFDLVDLTNHRSSLIESGFVSGKWILASTFLILGWNVRCKQVCMLYVLLRLIGGLVHLDQCIVTEVHGIVPNRAAFLKWRNYNHLILVPIIHQFGLPQHGKGSAKICCCPD
jgi:hypothetical protein